MAACGSHPAFAAEAWGRDRLLGGAGMRLGPLRDRAHPPGLEVMVAAPCQLTAPVPCSRASDIGQLGSLGVLHSSETTAQAGRDAQDACGQCPHQDQNPKPCPQNPTGLTQEVLAAQTLESQDPGCGPHGVNSRRLCVNMWDKGTWGGREAGTDRPP